MSFYKTPAVGPSTSHLSPMRGPDTKSSSTGAWEEQRNRFHAYENLWKTWYQDVPRF